MTLPKGVEWLVEASVVATWIFFTNKIAAETVLSPNRTMALNVGGTFAIVMIWFGYKRVSSWMYKRRIWEWSGIARVYPVKPYATTQNPPMVVVPSQREEAERHLSQAIKDDGSLQLLLVSGWYHIGTSAYRGVLYEALASHKSPLKLEVLLLTPTCKAAEERAAKIGQSKEHYAEGIRAVLWTLRSLKLQHKFDITAKLYDELPIWQMVVSKADLWLLCARDLPANESPVYCLQREAPYGLAYGLLGVWDRRWESAKEFDLDTMAEPDWAKVFHRPP